MHLIHSTSSTFWAVYAVSIILSVTLSACFFASNSIAHNSNCDFCPSTKTVIYNTTDDITFISVPRPFMNREQLKKYMFAISSWLSATPKSQVILYTNETEFDSTGAFQQEINELFGVNRVHYLGYLKSDQNDVPYIDDWFRRGVDDSETKYVCFINTDIVLSSKWMRRVKQVFRVFDENEKLVLINQRIDFDLYGIPDSLKFNSSDFLEEIGKIVTTSSHEDHSPLGIDTFTFKKDPLPFNVDEFPPYIVGRYNWDNWFVGYLNQYCTTVTFNLDPPVYHINHVRHSFDIEEPRVAVNHKLRQYNFDLFGSNQDTKYEISNGMLKKRFGSYTKLPNIVQ